MRKILAAAFALAVFIPAVAAHGAESIGKAQAVSPGINAGFEQTRRLVGAGGDIFFGETIASDPTGVLPQYCCFSHIRLELLRGIFF